MRVSGGNSPTAPCRNRIESAPMQRVATQNPAHRHGSAPQ